MLTVNVSTAWKNLSGRNEGLGGEIGKIRFPGKIRLHPPRGTSGDICI
jgi:hypothetical protein